MNDLIEKCPNRSGLVQDEDDSQKVRKAIRKWKAVSRKKKDDRGQKNSYWKNISSSARL